MMVGMFFLNVKTQIPPQVLQDNTSTSPGTGGEHWHRLFVRQQRLHK